MNRGIYTTLHNFIIKGTFTCTGGVCLLLLELCSVLDKGNPQQNAHKTLPSFATRFTTTGGGLRPASVCTLWALSRAKNTRAKNSSSNSSTFSEVLSLLSFTTPLDSLRSRVAPFTFFNRYTFVTLHVTPRAYITSVARIYNALPPRKLHICVLLRIRTPTTTPLPLAERT